MALSHSPKIVTDGLVLCLDAGDGKSYGGSGTTWTDRSGNGYNAIFTGDTNFDSSSNSIALDGASDVIQRSSLDVGVNFTFNIWAKCLANRTTLVANSYTYSTDNSGLEGVLFNIGNNNTDLFVSLGRDKYGVQSISGYVESNVWFNAGATFDGTSLKLYFNGEEVSYSSPFGNISNISTLTYGIDDLYLGGWKYQGGGYYSADLMQGNIANTQIYNKALTASEVLQNYNATKGRFS